jgi:hypothetical protein
MEAHHRIYWFSSISARTKIASELVEDLNKYTTSQWVQLLIILLGGKHMSEKAALDNN